MFRFSSAVIGLVALIAASGSYASPPKSVPLSPVQAENELGGTPAWNSIDRASWPEIELYTSQVSVVPGETVQIHVDTKPAARYRVELFRLGWYGGTGARLIACKPSCTGSAQGVPQVVPAPDAYGTVRADWPITETISIPNAASSGYYDVKAILTSGPDAGEAWSTPLIVKEPSTQNSAVLVVTPINTWEAYNNWGGKSLYAYNSTGGAAVKVSFDRPYSPDAQGPFLWEYPLVRFLERNGYDVSYTTDVDLDRDPSVLLKHQLIIVAGHDEYWTKAIRDGLEAAVAHGTNLAFLGADIGTWQVRYEDESRTIVAFRSKTLDPEQDQSLKTVRFREIGRPECSLLGVEFQGGQAATGDAPRAYRVVPGEATLPWATLGLAGDLPSLVGYEWDAVVPGCTPANATVVFHYQGKPSNADAVAYTAPSGAEVFSAGSLQFAWGLDGWGGHDSDVSPPLQTFVGNMFDAIGRPSPPSAIETTLDRGSVNVGLTPISGKSMVILRHPGSSPFAPTDAGVTVACETSGATCVDREPPGHRTWTYAAATIVGSALSSLRFAPPVGVPNHAPSLRLRVLGLAARARIEAVTADADGDHLILRCNVNHKYIQAIGDVIRIGRTTHRQRLACSVDDRHGGFATTSVTIARRR
jgi:hypothetical protein